MGKVTFQTAMTTAAAMAMAWRAMEIGSVS